MKCAGKQLSVMEVERAVVVLCRRKCLVGAVDFKLLALSLRPQRTHQGRKEGASGTGSSFQSTVENALWPSAQAGADRLMSMSL